MTFDITPYRKLYPFTSQYLELNGLRYHYLDEGSGEAVVMVHGNPTWSFYFRELVKALSPYFRVIVPDHIGCGLSDKPKDNKYNYTLESRVRDLSALLEHLQINKNITYIVHDWGGMIALAHMLSHPEQISRLVLMNTAGFLLPQGKSLPLRLALLRHLSFLATPLVQGCNIFAAAATFMASHKGLSADVKAGLVAPYNSWQNRLATLRFVQDIPLYPKDKSYSLVKFVENNLNQLSSIPTLVCWGKYDFVFNQSFLEEWQKRLPDAKYHIFEAGHYVLEDVPELILPLVKEFLEVET